MNAQINLPANEMTRLSDAELDEVTGGEQAVVQCALFFPGLIITVAASSGGYSTQKIRY
jgi:hypothetical protein